MTLTRPIQGRVLTEEDIAFVRRLLADHPTWSRNQLSLALAEAWSWRTDTGRLKNFASQSLLLKA
jgi:hypothetical protein